MGGAGDHLIWVGAAATVAASVIGGLVAWFTVRQQVKPQQVTASAQVQAAINSGFGVMTEKYERLLATADERDRARAAENAELVQKVSALEHTMDLLTGYVRQLLQLNRSLVTDLRAAGVDVPESKANMPPHPLGEPVLGVVLPWPKEG